MWKHSQGHTLNCLVVQGQQWSTIGILKSLVFSLNDGNSDLEFITRKVDPSLTTRRNQAHPVINYLAPNYPVAWNTWHTHT